MRFTHFTRILMLTGIATGMFNFSSCSSSVEVMADNAGNTQLITSETIEEFPLEELNEDETDGLIFMREEEKLARDVYITLNAVFNRRVFSNISTSEQRHMDAIKVLLDRYEIDDPSGINAIGIFKNETLQDLYTKLIEQGSGSAIEALKVGALIEEIDILDIQHELDEHVDNQDITFVYKNLLRGSHNHLRAFVRNLSRQGIDYQPQKLNEEQFELIINGG